MTQQPTTSPAAEVEHLCPNLRHLEPVDGQPVWCRPDQERIVRAIGRLPDLAAAMFERTLADDGRLAATSQSDATRKATRAGSPSGSPAWDVIDEVVTWAGDLEDRLRGTLNHARPSRAYWTGTTVVRATHLTASVAYLTTWSTALLSSPLAVQAGREALQLETRVERAAGLDRLRHRLPAPCPSCDRKALIRDDGAEQVDCVACGRRWTEADYRRLVVVLSDELQDVRPARGAHRPLGDSTGLGGRA